MFELNLIKDKAAARQRRRIVFLSIMSVVLLSGLLSMFVGGLIYQEFTRVKSLNEEIANQQNANDNLQMTIATREPAARSKRNGLINAWNESLAVQQDRPRFTPVLIDLSSHRPPTAEFWYNMITISRVGAARAGDEEFGEAEALMRSRSLTGSGYVQVLDSDILTESTLQQVAAAMDRMVPLVGEPEFILETREDARGGAAATEEIRYAGFQLSSAMRARSRRASGSFDVAD
jgi:hypothetical protein